jgi:hypothetical protein
VPGALSKIPSRYQLVLRGGHAAVDLGGGESTVTFPFPDPPRATRAVSGRVVDAAEHGVAGAIVMVGDHLTTWSGTLTAAAGTTTAADGSFSITDAPATPAVAVAFDPSGWSELAAVGDEPLVLHLRGFGSLHVRATYNGHAESFEMQLVSQTAAFQVNYLSDPDGTFTIASLPPGPYTAAIGLAQEIGGGASQLTTRQIEIAAGTTTELDIAQTSATTVVATAHGSIAKPGYYQYWLFAGTAPPTLDAARARASAEHPPAYLVGGQDLLVPVQFHDTSPGSYAACARTDANAFGCTAVTVLDGDTVRELEIVVQ